MCASASFISHCVCFNCRSKVRTRRPERTRPATTDHDPGVDKLQSSAVTCPPRKAHAAQRCSRIRSSPESAARLSAISVFFGSFPLLNGPGHRALPDDQALKHQAGSKLGSFQETGSSRSGFDLAELSVDRDDVLCGQPAAHCQTNGGSTLAASKTSYSSAWHWRLLPWSDPVPFVGIASVDKLGLHRSRAF